MLRPVDGKVRNSLYACVREGSDAHFVPTISDASVLKVLHPRMVLEIVSNTLLLRIRCFQATD